MSIEVMSKVFGHNMPALKTEAGKVVSPSTATFVLLALADKASADGENIYPSLRRLCRETKFSEPTVVNALNALRVAGYISHIGVSRRGTSEYVINLEKLVQFSGTKPSLEGTKQSLEGTKPSLDDPSFNRPEPEYISEETKVNSADVFNLANTLAEVTGLSMIINKKQLMAEAKALLKDPRVSSELIRINYSKGGAWYSQDWRGKQGQKPGLYHIRTTLFGFEAVQPTNVIQGGLKDRAIKEHGGLK